MLKLVTQWDKDLFLYLNNLHSAFWDNLMWEVSGKILWIPLYLVITCLIIRKYRWKSFYTIASVIILIVLSDQISVHFFKDVFQRLRPCHNPEIADIVHLVKDKCGGQFGFISSHATNTFALGTITASFLKNRYYTIFIFIWASLVSYSRIYLGVHYPGDVLGGILVGCFLAWGMYKLYKFLENKFHF